MNHDIKDRLRKAFFPVIREIAGDMVEEKDLVFEHPKEESFGDYSTNIALILCKKLKKNPMEIAQQIVEKAQSTDLTGKNGIADKISVAAPGFINVTLSNEILSSELAELLNKEEGVKSTHLDYPETHKGKKIMVEFAHPNTHKAFHIGHLRNITTGESIVRLLQALGGEVIRANYQGDVGMHIAKCLYAILQSQKLKVKSQKLDTIREKVEYLGKMYAAGSKAYEEDPVAKKEIEQINAKIYQKASDIEPLWKETRQWSLEYFDSIYKRLGTHYDRLYFESQVISGAEIAKEAVKKGILNLDQGAVIFNGKPYGLDTRVFINSLGLPTYEAKELKLAELEFSEFGNIDKIIHVVGPEQSSFFKVTFKVEELLDKEKFGGKQYHLAYGWVKLKKGKMSSRLGNVVLGEWLLEEAKKKIFDIIGDNKEYSDAEKETIAEKAAVAAVKYSFLKVAPQREIAFDLEESVSFEGDSGPYLLYTYARCKSVLRKSKEAKLQNPKTQRSKETKKFSFEALDFASLKLNPEESSLLHTFYRFPEVVGEAGKNLAPNLIATYIYDLAQKFNLFYNKHSILGNAKVEGVADQGATTTSFRLSLTEATAMLIKEGLYLLGIETVERM